MDANNHSKADAYMGAGVLARAKAEIQLFAKNFYHVEGFRRDGKCTCAGCQNYAKQLNVVLLLTGRREVMHDDEFLDPKKSALWFKAWEHLPAWLRNLDLKCPNAEQMFAFTVPNLVTTVGKNDALTQYFKGSAYTAAWFVGLVDNASFSAYAAGDTMASHAGWLESATYSNATRPAWTGGSVSAGSVDNSGSVAAFNINGTVTIRGAFQVTVSTKSGTTGILYGEADFAASRSLLTGDTLNVTVTDTLS